MLIILSVKACDSNTIDWWQTSEKSTDRLSRQTPICPSATLGQQVNSGAVQININATSRGQEILGFGGAFTQAAATVYSKLPSSGKKEFVEAYFGADGLGYTTGRIPIHSCDFSPKIYSFDDTLNDFNLTHFDTTLEEDTLTILPMLHDVLGLDGSSMKSARLYGSPWSPPSWMKSNDNMLEGGSLKGDALTQRAWASYISKWVTEYNKRLPVPIWGVTVQNEPEASQPWESCQYNATYERDFVANHLGPVLEAEHPKVQILGFDHNKDHLVEWADTLLAPNSSSAKYIDGIAFHWYAGSCFENIKTVSTKYPDKMLLPTEACYEMTVKHDSESGDEWLRNGTWARGEGYAQDILGDLNAGSAGWTDWNLLLDQKGGPNHVDNFCDAPIIANVSDDASAVYDGHLFLHPQYYYIGHFSKFLTPGAVHLDAQVTPALGQLVTTDDDCTGWPAYGLCKNDTLQVTAFERDDGKVACVVMNCADNSMPFQLRYGLGWFNNTVPGHSIQTYLL